MILDKPDTPLALGRLSLIMENIFEIRPVGIVNKNTQDVYIEIYSAYTKALFGLDEFSHILVLTWFHLNDTQNKREILRVHPKGNRSNPIRGVFGTRSPVRPNPIGISICELIEIKTNIVIIDDIDMFNGSPVIDIKPCIPNSDILQKVKVPGWATGDKTR